nr:MAG: ORF1ab protein [Wenzhou bat astrovirus 2]
MLAFSLDKQSSNKLRDLFDEDAITTCAYTRRNDKRTVKVTSVSDNDIATYVFSHDHQLWVLTDPVVDVSAIVATRMAQNLTQLREENQQLKADLSTLRMEHELTRHELERVRRQADANAPKNRSSNYVIKFFFGLLVGLLLVGLLPTAHALETNSTTGMRYENLTTNVPPPVSPYYSVDLDVWKAYLRDEFQKFSVGMTPRDIGIKLLALWQFWPVQVVTFLALAYVRYPNLLPSLILACLATWSGWELNALYTLPLLDTGGLVSLGICMFFYPLERIFAGIIMCLIVILNILISMAFGKLDVDKAIFSGGTLVLCYVLNIALSELAIPKFVPGVIFVIYRITLFYVKTPAVYQTRDSDGKIVDSDVMPPKQSAFSRFSQSLKKMFQRKPNTVVWPAFQVPANSTVLVRNKDGEGTGFRVQNYIVTAKHVFADSDTGEVVFEGKVHAVKIKWKHPEKDLVFLSLPPGLQDIKTYKLAKSFENGPVAVVTHSGDHVTFAVANGVQVGDEITYSMVTKDGTSGAPVIVESGRVVGVHTVNTGFSGGCVMLRTDDMPPLDSKSAKIAELEKKLEEYVASRQFQQKNEDGQWEEVNIVDLVREAVKREMRILREELRQSSTDSDSSDEASDFEQTRKGKTKRGKTFKKNATRNRQHGDTKHSGGGRPIVKNRPVWTEKEYKELLEKGYKIKDLKKMAQDIRDKEDKELDEAIEEAFGDGNPYPEYDDPGSEYEDEINQEWFSKQYGQKSPLSRFQQMWDEEFKPPTPKTHPEHLLEKFDVTCDDELKRKLSKKGQQLMTRITSLLVNTIDNTSWRPNIDARLVIDDLTSLYYDLNREMFSIGLEPFFQRSKNLQEGPGDLGPEEFRIAGELQEGSEGETTQDPDPEIHRIDGWKSYAEPASPEDRWLVPEPYPLLYVMDIDRPVVERDIPVDPLVGLLPRWRGELDYSPSVWGPEAYAKSFEKFVYKQPTANIKEKYPKDWKFAVWATVNQYSFLRGSVLIPIVATDKNMESTPAFPKAYFYKSELEYIEAHGFQYYVEGHKRVFQGERPDPLWYLFLKKEVLKKKKVRESDIRQILCTDPLYNRIGLVFEQHQNTLMKEDTENSFGQCGWTPFEGGWHRRMLRLERPGNTYVEMDWSRFDGTIPPEVFLQIKDIRFGMLAPEYRTKKNRAVYNWYVHHLLNRYVLLPSGEITFQDRGNPSGQVSTTMDNNMVNTFLQAFEFSYLNNLGFDEAKERWESYDTIVYGDDRVTSTPCLPEDYQTRVIDMYGGIFGMWVKPENVKVTDSLLGVSFCGFTNVKIGGTYLPVPSNVNKLVASLITPVRKLQDMEAMAGKVLSFKVLMHNLPDDDPGKQFILECEIALKRHMELAGQPWVNFTNSMLDYLWRGGPKGGHGVRQRKREEGDQEGGKEGGTEGGKEGEI